MKIHQNDVVWVPDGSPDIGAQTSWTDLIMGRLFWQVLVPFVIGVGVRGAGIALFRYTEPQMSETLFIIGREPELSVAELEAVAPSWAAEVIDIQPTGVLLCHDQPLASRAIDRLGGSVKQVAVAECYDPAEGLLKLAERVCTADWLTQQFSTERIEFGVSVYGWSSRERQAIQKHFLGLKKAVHASGRPVRLAISKEPQMSAVTVHRNGLDKRGKEFVFFRTSENIVLGVTTAVQDYQAYAVRDFGRPAANPKSGMLPPKVAQMMLNIAQVKSDDVLLDPFCGSGTVLQEALLLGAHEVHGSDSEGRAVRDSQENIRWLMKEYSKIQATAEITKRDVREGGAKPSVIVTEPYLGLALRGNETQKGILAQAKQLETLYRQAATQWSKSLRPGGRLVMIWPEFVVNGEYIVLDLAAEFQRLRFSPQPVLTEKAAQLVNNGDRFVLTYGRDDAKVRRQIRKWTLAK